MNKRIPFYLDKTKRSKLRSPIKTVPRQPFYPNEIRWGVSPDHCSPYRRLTGHREPEPPYVPPEPPEPPDPVDPHYFDVVLLVGSESGTNLDESTYHYGTGSTPGTGVSATNAKFGTHSIDPATGYISYDGAIGDHNFDLASTQMMEFTIEAWVYPTHFDNATTPMVIVGKSFFSISWAFVLEPNSTPRFAYQTLESGFGGNGKFTNILATAPYTLTVPFNQWTYVAVTKDAAKHFRLYVGDPATNTVKMVGKRTPNDASIDNTGVLEGVDIGQIGLFGTNNWNGQVDEIRITKNVARYRTDTSFPMPRRAWPRPPPTTARSWENAESLRSYA